MGEGTVSLLPLLFPESFMNCILLVKAEKSRRLDVVKALVPLGGKTLLAIMLGKALPLFRRILLVTTDANRFRTYETANISLVQDDLKCGPLGGIYTGLERSDSFFSFVLATDLPFVGEDVLSRMMQRERTYDILVPETKNRIHPLCAIYAKTVLPCMKKNMAERKFKVMDLLDQANTVYLDETALNKEGEPEEMFFNLNTPRDWEYCRKRGRKQKGGGR